MYLTKGQKLLAGLGGLIGTGGLLWYLRKKGIIGARAPVAVCPTTVLDVSREEKIDISATIKNTGKKETFGVDGAFIDSNGKNWFLECKQTDTLSTDQTDTVNWYDWKVPSDFALGKADMYIAVYKNESDCTNNVTKKDCSDVLDVSRAVNAKVTDISVSKA